jgi:hypothetical protein
VAVAAAVWYWLWKLHGSTAEHTRFDVAVGAVDSYCVLPHVVNTAHTRSEVALGPTVSYWLELQVVSPVHTLSLLAVGAVDCQVPASFEQTVYVLHTRFEVYVGATVWY